MSALRASARRSGTAGSPVAADVPVGPPPCTIATRTTSARPFSTDTGHGPDRTKGVKASEKAAMVIAFPRPAARPAASAPPTAAVTKRTPREPARGAIATQGASTCPRTGLANGRPLSGQRHRNASTSTTAPVKAVHGLTGLTSGPISPKRSPWHAMSTIPPPKWRPVAHHKPTVSSVAPASAPSRNRHRAVTSRSVAPSRPMPATPSGHHPRGGRLDASNAPAATAVPDLMLNGSRAAVGRWSAIHPILRVSRSNRVGPFALRGTLEVPKSPMLFGAGPWLRRRQMRG